MIILTEDNIYNYICYLKYIWYILAISYISCIVYLFNCGMLVCAEKGIIECIYDIYQLTEDSVGQRFLKSFFTFERGNKYRKEH